MSKSQAAISENISGRATYQDVLDAPSHKVAEVVNGTLYIFDRPAFRDAIAGSRLGGFLTHRSIKVAAALVVGG